MSTQTHQTSYDHEHIQRVTPISIPASPYSNRVSPFFIKRNLAASLTHITSSEESQKAVYSPIDDLSSLWFRESQAATQFSRVIGLGLYRVSVRVTVRIRGEVMGEIFTKLKHKTLPGRNVDRVRVTVRFRG